jgi:hypothetical protein
MKKILLSLIMFALLLQSTQAVTTAPDVWYSLDAFNGTTNSVITEANYGNSVLRGSITALVSGQLLNNSFNFTGNQLSTPHGWYNISASESFMFCFWFLLHDTNDVFFFEIEAPLGFPHIFYQYAPSISNFHRLGYRTDVDGTLYRAIYFTDALQNSEWHYVCAGRDGSTLKNVVYLDGLMKVNSTENYSADPFTFGPTINLTIAEEMGGGAGVDVRGTMDDFKFYQGQIPNGQQVYDEYNFGNPLGFSIVQGSYNVTSAYLNATAWRSNQSDTVFTYDATPTVTFSLTIAGNCTIGRNPFNYTTMLANDSNTLCATTGTSSQSCTLPLSQHLTQGLQNIYIACNSIVDTFTNSSALAIQLDPVSINNQTYNVSNAYINATAWRINANNTVFMRDRMPTVYFNTSFGSNCSISIYQQNYTQMIANDSASDCGDDLNVSHICVLPASLQLVNGPQFLYISCLSIGAEPIGGKSTSLPLNISMDRRIIVQVQITNGSINSTYASADVYLINQADNSTLDKGHVNSTGGISFFVANSGTYLVYGYDKSNSSVEGDIKNHVVVS